MFDQTGVLFWVTQYTCGKFHDHWSKNIEVMIGEPLSCNVSFFKKLKKYKKPAFKVAHPIKLLIIPHGKLLQTDRLFTHQQFTCLALSTSESCRMIDIVLPRKPNVCHVRDTKLP